MKNLFVLPSIATVIVGCSSGAPTVDPPSTTTDPSSYPGYYDTEIVSYDAQHNPIIVWQHTTPEQYAEEVAAHTGHPIAATETPSSNDVGSTSSAVISSTSCSNSNALWLYNYNSISGSNCNGPDGWTHLRICYINSDTNTWDHYDLNNDGFTTCVQSPPSCSGPWPWAGNVQMFWPGTNNAQGSFGGYHLILIRGQYHNVYLSSQTFNSGQACTANDGTEQHYIALQ